jgi:hypothetical protein
MSAPPPSAVDGDHNEATCKCDRMMAVNIMCGLGVVSSILVILAAILTLIEFDSGVPGFILSIYLVILGLMVFVAEMRIFRAIRGLIFHGIKYVYFLTGCIGRGVFYFFIGSCSFIEDKPITWVACIASCLTGLLLIGLDLKFKFPVYIDPQVAKMQAEARLKWERDEAERKLAQASIPRAEVERQLISAANSASKSAADLPPTMAREAYEPPRI